MAAQFNSAVLDMTFSGIREYTGLAKRTPGCIQMTLGEPEFNTPDAIKDAAKAALDANMTHYPDNSGDLYLREAIVQYEREHNGVTYTPDEVILTLGATEALFCGLFGILNPGDEVIIPTPAFGLYEQLVLMCRGKCVFLDTSKCGFQITAEMLAGAITERTKAIIINSPNNPTGCVYTDTTMEAIRRAVSENDMFAICDDVYRGLIYTQSSRSFASYQELHDRILVVQSFSKPYAMTGWRVGYLLSDAPVREQLRKVHQYAVVSAVSFIQPACVAALRYDYSGMRETYRMRRDSICGRMQAMGLRFTKPEGAFYAFPSIEQFGMGSGEFCKRMIAEAKVAAVPGACFGTEGHIRLSYCVSDGELEEGMNRLERFISTL